MQNQTYHKYISTSFNLINYTVIYNIYNHWLFNDQFLTHTYIIIHFCNESLQEEVEEEEEERYYQIDFLPTPESNVLV